MLTTILFDLDETLYPAESGVMDQIRELIFRYLQTRLGLAAHEADVLRRRYLRQYGTTMRGLQINEKIDPDDYLQFVHSIPLENYLKANPELAAVLAGIPQQKVVFTNASREHAVRVLALLGIGQHFSRIIDVRDVGYESKPQPLAYRRACELLGVRPDECLIVEDSVGNLLPAKAVGMTTVLVRNDSSSARDDVDYVIVRIEEIRSVVERIATRDLHGLGASAERP